MDKWECSQKNVSVQHHEALFIFVRCIHYYNLLLNMFNVDKTK